MRYNWGSKIVPAGKANKVNKVNKKVELKMGVLKYNKLYDDFCWMGVQDFPSLDIDVFGEDTSTIPEALCFE